MKLFDCLKVAVLRGPTLAAVYVIEISHAVADNGIAHLAIESRLFRCFASGLDNLSFPEIADKIHGLAATCQANTFLWRFVVPLLLFGFGVAIRRAQPSGIFDLTCPSLIFIVAIFVPALRFSGRFVRFLPCSPNDVALARPMGFNLPAL